MSSTEWKEANKERMREWSKQYYWDHREEQLAGCRKRREENREKYNAQRAEYRKRNKEKIAANDLTPSRRMTTAKSMAKKRGHLWDLSLEQYEQIIKNPCDYCENKLGEPVKKGSGLDRMDCAKGYEPDNVVSCCNFCNSVKSDKLSYREMKAVAKTLIRLKEKKDELE